MQIPCGSMDLGMCAVTAEQVILRNEWPRGHTKGNVASALYGWGTQSPGRAQVSVTRRIKTQGLHPKGQSCPPLGETSLPELAGTCAFQAHSPLLTGTNGGNELRRPERTQ